MASSVRSTAERIAHARRRLSTAANIWVATTSSDGNPHSVPLSLGWIDEQVVVVTSSHVATAVNASECSDVRAHLDSSDDVVIVDGTASVVPLDDYDHADTLIERIGWDPNDSPENEWSVIIIDPYRVQVWIGPDEVAGRTVMRDGRWLA